MLVELRYPAARQRVHAVEFQGADAHRLSGHALDRASERPAEDDAGQHRGGKHPQADQPGGHQLVQREVHLIERYMQSEQKRLRPVAVQRTDEEDVIAVEQRNAVSVDDVRRHVRGRPGTRHRADNGVADLEQRRQRLIR